MDPNFTKITENVKKTVQHSQKIKSVKNENRKYLFNSIF